MSLGCLEFNEKFTQREALEIANFRVWSQDCRAKISKIVTLTWGASGAYSFLCYFMLSVVKRQFFYSLRLVIFELSQQSFVCQIERVRILPIMVSNFR